MVHSCQRSILSIWMLFFITGSIILIVGTMYAKSSKFSLLYGPSNPMILNFNLIRFTSQLDLNHEDQQTGSKNYSFLNPKNNSSSPTRVVDNRSPKNKFLNGLLSFEEFDPASCLSRHESHKYRKPSTYTPSLYLISELRKYESLHKWCGPHSIHYKAAIKKLQTKSNNTKYDENVTSSEICDYIVWKPFHGLGNRILSITSAFLYAILTNRVLLVEFYSSSMDSLFCEPFPNSTWLLSKDFPLPSNSIDNDNIRTLYSILHEKSTTTHSSSTLAAPICAYVDIRSYSHNLNNFQCDHSQDILRKVPILILESDYYFTPSLFLISSFNQELNKLFPDKDIVFHLLAHYLFHPSNEAWVKIGKFYHAYLSHVDERVGLQIRLFDPVHISHKHYMRQILSCTSSYNLLPKMETIHNTTIKTPHYKNHISSNTVVLVASLYSMYAENLKVRYSTNHVYGNRVAIYQPSHEGRQNSSDNQHNMKAWVDMYLLSLCDEMVTSARSTFGYVAQGLAGLKPWILTLPMEKDIPDPPCRRALSMEPCLLHTPRNVCKTKTKLMNSISPYIQTCEDISWGVKLKNVIMK